MPVIRKNLSTLNIDSDQKSPEPVSNSAPQGIGSLSGSNMTRESVYGSDSVPPVSKPPLSSSYVSNDSVNRSGHGIAKVLITVLILALIGISAYYYISLKGGSGSILSPLNDLMKKTEGAAGITPNSSGAYEDPINGMRFSDADAAKFKDLKPISVMVNNYVEARPTFGLTKADIVYEVVAEAGITRLMPIFYSRIPEKVESIRSARYYFAQLAAPYHPHFIHWGAAFVPACQKAAVGSKDYCPPVGGKVETDPKVDAYDQIVKLGLPNLDGGNYACDGPNCVFSRDHDRVGKVPIEHTAFVRLPMVYDLAKKIRPEDAWHKFTPFVQWKFKDEAALADRGDIGAATPITYKYWDTMPGFDVKWTYDKDKNEYVRYQGGVKQVDELYNNAELRAKDVVIRFTVETPVGDHKGHMFHDIVGSGKGLVFHDGKVDEVTWSRATPEDMDVYKDSKGNLYEFVRGQIWVQLVPSTNIVSYTAAAATQVKK